MISSELAKKSLRAVKDPELGSTSSIGLVYDVTVSDEGWRT